MTTEEDRLVLTPDMRVDAAARRADRLAELQAIVGPMPPLVESGPAQDAEARVASDPPVAVPDEARLRDMLRTIVREELEGELGERVTANLRRLVRQEVEQALALRELDRPARR